MSHETHDGDSELMQGRSTARSYPVALPRMSRSGRRIGCRKMGLGSRGV